MDDGLVPRIGDVRALARRACLRLPGGAPAGRAVRARQGGADPDGRGRLPD
ncbi:hypothetical protein [Streptomyces sp. NRRL S-1022]|uniref:hypothetical protein n=1 Tax=Streptomyces sp. NRRL S-1022 TaxID=1463880 RepID=UPI00131EB76C|nr:hypothetical protein [Streptomyces sp. NRRL S-1022]